MLSVGSPVPRAVLDHMHLKWCATTNTQNDALSSAVMADGPHFYLSGWTRRLVAWWAMTGDAEVTMTEAAMG